MDGNARFVAGGLTSPHQTPARRSDLTSGQSPFAVILGCADSRVPPEIVFDAGLGDLFVRRVAGNAPSTQLIASIEYGVGVLHAPLIMVLGHSSCGAVQAAVDSIAQGKPLPTGHLQDLINELAFAVTAVQSQPGDPTDSAITRNVQIAVQQLSVLDPILLAGVMAGSLKIVGARHDLAGGRVTRVPQLPGQPRLEES
jgi:carbonic anhydrase